MDNRFMPRSEMVTRRAVAVAVLAQACPTQMRRDGVLDIITEFLPEDRECEMCWETWSEDQIYQEEFWYHDQHKGWVVHWNFMCPSCFNCLLREGAIFGQPHD